MKELAAAGIRFAARAHLSCIPVVEISVLNKFPVWTRQNTALLEITSDAGTLHKQNFRASFLIISSPKTFRQPVKLLLQLHATC
jgi:hypothetical protein